MGVVKHFPLRMAWNNFADTPSLIVANSQVASLPATFLQNQQIGKPFRSLAIAGLTIDMNFGSAQGVQQFALRKHNISLAGVTITLSGATNAAFSPTAVSVGITPAADILLFDWGGTVQNYQYWRLEVEDPGNTDAFIELGYMFLGEFDEFDFPNQNTATSKVDPATKRTNYDGSFVVFTKAKFRRIDFAISPTQQVDRRKLEEIYDEVGVNKGLFVFLDAKNNRDTDGYHRLTVFGTFQGAFTVNHMAIDWHDVDSLVFEEIR